MEALDLFHSVALCMVWSSFSLLKHCFCVSISVFLFAFIIVLFWKCEVFFCCYFFTGRTQIFFMFAACNAKTSPQCKSERLASPVPNPILLKVVPLLFPDARVMEVGYITDGWTSYATFVCMMVANTSVERYASTPQLPASFQIKADFLVRGICFWRHLISANICIDTLPSSSASKQCLCFMRWASEVG